MQGAVPKRDRRGVLTIPPTRYSKIDVHEHWRTKAEISGFVLTSVLTRLIREGIFRPFTYDKRRGRESNPRIAVLQTATLPLGYPAIGARTDRNARAQSVNAARPFMPSTGERWFVDGLIDLPLSDLLV
jgi:hypothetical protein